jgi:hypothetical protein
MDEVVRLRVRARSHRELALRSGQHLPIGRSRHVAGARSLVPLLAAPA